MRLRLEWSDFKGVYLQQAGHEDLRAAAQVVLPGAHVSLMVEGLGVVRPLLQLLRLHNAQEPHILGVHTARLPWQPMLPLPLFRLRFCGTQAELALTPHMVANLGQCLIRVAGAGGRAAARRTVRGRKRSMTDVHSSCRRPSPQNAPRLALASAAMPFRVAAWGPTGFQGQGFWGPILE